MNKYLLNYSVFAIIRNKIKNIFVFSILTLLIFFISSSLIISTALKSEVAGFTDVLPDMIVQKQRGMRLYDIEESYIDKIIKINGVEAVEARVWGYYPYDYSLNQGIFTIIGINEFKKNYKKIFDKIANSEFKIFDENTSYMLLGQGVKNILSKDLHTKYFNFIKPDGGIKKVYISGVINENLGLYSNDVVLLSTKNAKEILGIEDKKATDLFIYAPNLDELSTIEHKIKDLIPDAKITTKKDLIISYESIFSYKSGFFLSLFAISLLTFFIVIYDKVNSIQSSEKYEIAILRALGWGISDVIKEKLYESFILSFFSYGFGVFLSYIFIYIFDAPILKDIFSGFTATIKNNMHIPFVLDLQTLFLIFFIVIPIYIGANIIPAWKIASIDSDEVLK